MGFKKISLRFAALMMVVGTAGSGCAMLEHLFMKKDLSVSADSNAHLSQAGATFKEVPYGAAVGTVVVPTFQTATTQVLDTLGMTMAQAASVRNVNTTVGGNLPEVGVASSLTAQAVFAYSKLYVAACTDKCNLDRGSAAPAASERLCTFDTSKPHNDAANSVAWDASITKMAELFWGRADLTADEKAALIALRDEVGAVAVEKTGNKNNGTLPAFQAVCATMAMAPASLVQ